MQSAHKAGAVVGADVLAALGAAGHDVEIVPAFSSMMGHAGAIVRHPTTRGVSLILQQAARLFIVAVAVLSTL